MTTFVVGDRVRLNPDRFGAGDCRVLGTGTVVEFRGETKESPYVVAWDGLLFQGEPVRGWYKAGQIVPVDGSNV